RDAPEECQQSLIEPQRVSLHPHAEDSGAPQLARHATLNLPHPFLRTLEQLQKARLRAARALHAAELERLEPVEQLFRVEQKLLHPQRDALSDGRELRGLEVGVGQARQVAVAACQLGERHHDGRDPSEQQLQPLAHQDQVGVVGDVRAGRAEVEEGARRRRLVPEVMDVRHHVVPHTLLVLGGALQIGVVQVRAQLSERPVGDGEAELALGLHEREPQPPPQADPPALSPQRLHRGRSVALAQRREVCQTAAFARATRLFQSARNCSSPRSVSGCSSSFFKTSGGSVATSAPIIAASNTWRGWRIEAARISVAIWKLSKITRASRIKSIASRPTLPSRPKTGLTY